MGREMTDAIQITDEQLERFENLFMPEPMSGCWLWLGPPDRDGYGHFALCRTKTRAHRTAYLIWRGDPGESVVRHSCDNPACVNPGHLLLGSHADNVADRKKRNRTAAGENHGSAKLSRKQVEEIRGTQRYRGMYERLAEKFGVCPTTIKRVKTGARWAP